ncbi:LysM peptidoglycan-binding domain-containing protein [Caproiciproducens galactitolivorans]|uniref:Spore germination protein YaaH n=1 Tax=Caproiciproducens galactitolivorans TaxID=642589 RepID=A0A4Z0YDV6_9FIRM|nr:LysM domain-containing protein [Caproiciproducens galactitolivorans]TGJ77615.1 spore germination protein YaaH [Caproiciproducens galactitolivorans]
MRIATTSRWESIISANGIYNPDVLVVGETLVIPLEGVVYIVQPGETLWLIGQRYNIPLQNLIQVNRIDDPNRIAPGMLLVIPSKTRPVIRVNGHIYMLGRAAVPMSVRTAVI